MQVAIYDFRYTIDGEVLDVGEAFDLKTDENGTILRFWRSVDREHVVEIQPGQPKVDTTVAPLMMFTYKLANGALLAFSKNRVDNWEEPDSE